MPPLWEGRANRNRHGHACWTAAWRDIAHKPVGEPAAIAARMCGTPNRRKLTYRVGPFPHRRQITIRSLRRIIRASRLRSTGSWLKPKWLRQPSPYNVGLELRSSTLCSPTRAQLPSENFAEYLDRAAMNL